MTNTTKTSSEEQQQPSGGRGNALLPSFTFGSLNPPSDLSGARGKAGRGGARGGAEVAEKRHRRRIKNRESAARSRARKLAYNIQQQVEIKELMKENELLRNTIKILSTNLAHSEDGHVKLSLIRTLSGPL